MVLEMVTFVVIAFRHIWELRNKILHEVIAINVSTLDWLRWQVDNDLVEVAHKFKIEERDLVEFVGNGSNGLHISYLSLTQSSWILLVYDAIKLNVSAT